MMTDSTRQAIDRVLDRLSALSADELKRRIDQIEKDEISDFLVETGAIVAEPHDSHLLTEAHEYSGPVASQYSLSDLQLRSTLVHGSVDSGAVFMTTGPVATLAYGPVQFFSGGIVNAVTPELLGVGRSYFASNAIISTSGRRHSNTWVIWHGFGQPWGLRNFPMPVFIMPQREREDATKLGQSADFALAA